MSDLKRMESPFLNDPFSLVWEAFHNLYPDKECEKPNGKHDCSQCSKLDCPARRS